MDMAIDMLEVEIILSFYRSANSMLCVTKAERKLFLLRHGEEFEIRVGIKFISVHTSACCVNKTLGNIYIY